MRRFIFAILAVASLLAIASEADARCRFFRGRLLGERVHHVLPRAGAGCAGGVCAVR